jgi:SM-20-related protein
MPGEVTISWPGVGEEGSTGFLRVRPEGGLCKGGSGTDLDDVILEVPPVEGTLLAFRRRENSWHGHKPFVGERRVSQFNWVTSEEVVRREQNRHRFSATVKKSFRPFATHA